MDPQPPPPPEPPTPPDPPPSRGSRAGRGRFRPHLAHDALAHRGFRWLLTGRTIDAVGNAIAPIALGFGVLDLFGSVSSLGVVVAATTLGRVLLLVVGGVVADRLPRALVLIGSNLAAAGISFAVAGLVMAETSVLWPLIVLGFLSGAAGAFDFPATAALVPQTVPEDTLERANGLLRLSLSGSFILGASLGGGLVAVIGPGPALLVDAVSFLLATACYARIEVEPLVVADRASPLADLVEGWREFRTRTWVWTIVVAAFFVNAAWVGGFHVLGIAVADAEFGRAGWGIVVGAQSAGAVAGALAAGWIRPRRPLVLGLLLTAVTATPLVALAVRPQLWLLIPVGLVAGFCVTQFGIAWESALQRHIPREKLARVSSFDAVGSWSAMPLGQVAVGPLAEAHGVNPVLLAAGAIVVVAALAPLASADVRNLRGAPR